MATTGSLTESTTFVPAPSTVRGQSTKLSASPDGSKIAYGAGRNAVIRSLHEPAGPGTVIVGHAAPVTVARISPTGYYCASGDSAGNLKVWDVLNPTAAPKLETKPIARVTDVAFDGEGKRIVLVGEGRDRFGATFSLDTGASIGEIGGHAKPVNAVAMKLTRPFRAVTASDDFTVVVNNGVPFKFASQSRKHSRFVQSVDYAPSGALFCSAGSDGSLFLYDGATGHDKATFVDAGEQAHKGTIYQASFSKDGTSIATSSADQTVKLWDVETQKVVQTWDFASTSSSPLANHQVGNVFAAATLVSLSFSGVLNLLDPRSSTPTSHIYGHQNPVTALAASGDSYVSGDSAGVLYRYGKDGLCSPVEGAGHSNLVIGLVEAGKGELWSASFDDTCKKLSPSSYSSTTHSTGSIPKGITATSSSSVFIATAHSVQSIAPSPKSVGVSYTPSCIAASSDNKLVAVGAEENKCYLYAANGLEKKHEIELRNKVTAVAFSPDSSKLAIGSTDGKVFLYDALTFQLLHARFSFQTARINALAFNAAGTHLASASLDESIRVYSLDKPSNVLSAKNVHRGGVAAVLWDGETTLVSGGADGSIKTLNVKL